ncbi:hypothetical protein FOS14_19810 [Skermania sp. ID1734]|nr:hypothetical protein FOS14_19810 [Skermania sp. ID1734]
MVDPTDERAAIQAAMQRLLDGTPQQSTGRLTIMQLAAEAGVKRWVLTHKHTDLAAQFRDRARRTGPTPTAFQPLQQRARDAENRNRRLHAENTALRSQLSAYAQLIHELATELERVRRSAISSSATQNPVHRLR